MPLSNLTLPLNHNKHANHIEQTSQNMIHQHSSCEESFHVQIYTRQRTQATLLVLNLRAAFDALNCVFICRLTNFPPRGFVRKCLLTFHLLENASSSISGHIHMDFHATWWSGHVSSIKTDQMIGGARPHRNHCAQLGEWMPANHYASKWDATSKKVQATSAKRAHLLRELTANIYYSNSAVKYPTCYQNSTLKGGKPVCERILE